MRHPLIFVAVLKQSHLAPQFIHQEAWRTILLMFLEWSILLDFFMPSKLGHYIFYYVFMSRLQVFIVVGNRPLFFLFGIASPAFGGLAMTEGVSGTAMTFSMNNQG